MLVPFPIEDDDAEKFRHITTTARWIARQEDIGTVRRHGEETGPFAASQENIEAASDRALFLADVQWAEDQHHARGMRSSL